MTALITNAVVATASYYPPAPAQNADWDVLYVAVGLIGIVLLVVLSATMLNHHDDHRAHHH